MSILTNVIEKKQSGEIKVDDERVYKSELLGEDILIKKKPLSEFMDILSDAQEEGNEIVMMNHMIHAFCPMFQDPDGVKAAVEFYGAATPRDLPELVFESNMSELGEILEIIMSFYDMESLDDDIKN